MPRKPIDIKVNSKDLNRYVRYLSSQVNPRWGRLNSRWATRFVSFTEKRMKFYSKGRTKRSKGRLSSSISKDFNISKHQVSGEVFVPGDIPYAEAANYGIENRTTIKGRPKMTFPSENWQNASVKVPQRGFFVFTRIKRGRYKGLHFFSKSFKDLIKELRSRQNQMLSEYNRVFLRG